jgi:hypothetical protein
MKKIILTIFIFFITGNSFSQSGKIFAEINYNSFSHSLLSEFQQEFIGDLPSTISIETVDDFPSNIGFTVGYEIVNINTSIFMSYNSTGGKISYADFSGIIKLEQLLTGITLGGIYDIPLDKKKRFKLGLKGFAMLSSLDIESTSMIGSDANNDSLSFDSFDYGLGAQFRYEYPVSFFIIRAHIGYDVVLSGKLKFQEIKEAHLLNNSGEDVKTGWTGLRTGVGIAIPIN